jgi:acyl transferase domain-containing protein
VDAFPKTTSGKIDRRALPRPRRTRPDLAQEFVTPRQGLEAGLASIWCEILHLDRVGSHDPFFELGGNSLLSAQMLTRCRQQLGVEIPMAAFFQFPTIAGLAEYLAPRSAGEKGVRTLFPFAQKGPDTFFGDAVAIVGMAGRFPGAANVQQLWRNLCGGVESVQFFADEQLDASIPPAVRNDPAYVKARGVLDGVELFDAAFFGVSPREAEVMDPQQRVFLETAWEALENAGCDPERFAGSIGVYAGSHNNSYFPWAVAKRPDLIARLGEFQTMLANEKDYLATRTAYALNLRGPAISINTACSTSLVAVVQAVHSLLGRQCDMALAGGVAIICPQNSGFLAQEGAMLSPDGHCRPFDADAGGTLFSSGVGIVVLKRLQDALDNRDTIYAVIRGAAFNNDGARKTSFTAPAVQGQAEVIAQAQAMAGVDADSISYVEAHGTATPLGDPVEIEALTQVFRERTDRKHFCTLGSLKSNFGHVVSAAGVAGLIKTSLALHHEQLPPTLHFDKPSPRIDWANSPFRVSVKLEPWPRQASPRRAGVSSFGVGGTNAHVVLQEAPASKVPAVEPVAEQLLVLSARSKAALEQATANLSEYLRDTQNPLSDVAFTLQAGRRQFGHRCYVVARSKLEAATALDNPKARPVETRHCTAAGPGVVWLFPGQGTQHAGMGRELYQAEPEFHKWFDRCATLVEPWLGRDLREVVFAEGEGVLDQTRFAQPAIFSFSYALAKLWQSWGVHPAAMLGHSVGEFVAACLADVFSLEDGLRVVVRRSELMQAQPVGSMLSVRLPADKVRTWLDDTSAIASINGPSLCVVSGPVDSISRIEERCKTDGIACRRLRTSHAFHSPMMDPVVEPFAVAVKQVKLSPPRIPIVSTVTGRLLTAEQATDPTYWSRHLRATVQFAQAVATAVKDPDQVLLEVGPRNTLATLARQQCTPHAPREAVPPNAIASLETSANGQGERAALLQAAGRLWLAGVTLDWAGMHADKRRRVPLPTYPFQRQRYWIEPSLPPTVPVPQKIEEEVVMTPGRTQRIIRELNDLFEESSGLNLGGASPDATFFELGLDSLFLTQACLLVQNKYRVPVTFRQLMEQVPSLARLAEYIDQQLPAEAVAVKQPAAAMPQLSTKDAARPATSPASGELQQVIAQQLQIMARQLELLGGSALPFPAPSTNGTHHAPPAGSKQPAEVPAKPFGAAARITLKQEGLTAAQKDKLADIALRYTTRTATSKERTQRYRKVLADPRVVSGFRPETKELVYPLVVEHSQGCKLRDIDGNEYIDLACGFGSNFFGFSASFVVEAVTAQLHAGFEIGPQHPLTGEVAEKICQFTGMERVVFCNTGSEAVLGAVRLARTVTGRDTVAIFNGSYHGIADEVIVRGGKNGRSVPAAAGIPAAAVTNVLLLDYGTPEALKTLRERAGDLAAVLVEPVQSRHPDLQPREFLHEMRQVTEAARAALIFDEVITGFRLHPGGAQAWFDVKADIATYGKVIGGGLPIGVIAGRARYMDALDGGFWQFGDASIPEAGVTYFAGTFVRHPLALAAASAVLDHLQRAGIRLYDDLNAQTAGLVARLNAHFAEVRAPLKLECCGSMFKVVYTSDVPFGELLYTLLRLRGLHIWDARPCFLTTAHQPADVEKIVLSFTEAVGELQEAGFYPEPSKPSRFALPAPADNGPPVPEARLGKDPQGQPGWYAPDPSRPGKFVKVGDVS